MARTFVTGGSGFVGQALIRTLVAQGAEVVAHARSEASAATVAAEGATAVTCPLDDPDGLARGMRGAAVVFHAAGHLSEWGPYSEFHAGNVVGTKAVVAAAQRARVPTLVAVGASAVVMGRPRPLRDIDETLPLQGPAWAPYIATKAEAERIVRAADSPEMRTVVVRPPLIWGAGMPMLDELVAAVRKGVFVLPDGGRQVMSTSHVDNVVACLLLAAERGRGGEAYFVADEDRSTLRRIAADLLATRGLPEPTRSAPFALAWRMAAIMEAGWRAFRLASKPPATRQTLRMIGQDFTLDIAKARRELGYAPVISRASGLAAMRPPRRADPPAAREPAAA